MMGKIVGNAFILFFMLFSPAVFAHIALQVFDENRAPLVQAGVGRSFLIEVSVSNINHIGRAPEITGLDQFVVKSSGTGITIINGKTTAKYTFQVRIDSPGSYTIGPAHFSDGKNQMSSNEVRVVVGKEQIEQHQKGARKQDAPVLLRLSADKEQAVVGERIQCKLRFYYTDPTLSLRQFIEQDAKDLRRKKARGPYSGAERLNEVDYNYVEWDWEVFPQKPGKCIIPAYGADYERETERDDFWGGLGKFLGNQVETKRVYSNAISLTVDPLPDSNKSMQAIGDFSAITISASPTVAKKGEGIVVAVEIIGDGDPDSIIFPGLSGVPDSLRHYESKQTVIEPTQKGQQTKKRFEYIVQGLKTGTSEIPAQSFYYFDTKSRTFNTLKTLPLSITIMPGDKKAAQVTIDEPTDSDSKQIDSIALQKGPWYPASTGSSLPWWLFVFIVLMPVALFLYQLISHSLVKSRRGSYQMRRAKKAFLIAHKRLATIKKSHKPQELYKLFIELFADKWQQPIAAISAQTISARLEQAGIDNKQLAAWEHFFSCIAERAFGAKKMENDKGLFEKAEQWLKRLEKLL